MEDDTRLFLILIQDGKIPEVKQPTEKNLKEALEYYEKKPEIKTLVARVRTYNNDLWVDGGKEELYKIKVFEEMAKTYHENVKKTEAVLNEIKVRYPSKYPYVIEFMEEGDVQHDYTYLEYVTEPKGQKSECYKFTWVDEHLGGGMTGDSFQGNGYVYLAKNKYVKIPYSM